MITRPTDYLARWWLQMQRLGSIRSGRQRLYPRHEEPEFVLDGRERALGQFIAAHVIWILRRVVGHRRGCCRLRALRSMTTKVDVEETLEQLIGEQCNGKLRAGSAYASACAFPQRFSAFFS